MIFHFIFESKSKYFRRELWMGHIRHASMCMSILSLRIFRQISNGDGSSTHQNDEMAVVMCISHSLRSIHCHLNATIFPTEKNKNKCSLFPIPIHTIALSIERFFLGRRSITTLVHFMKLINHAKIENKNRKKKIYLEY